MEEKGLDNFQMIFHDGDHHSSKTKCQLRESNYIMKYKTHHKIHKEENPHACNVRTGFCPNYHDYSEEKQKEISDKVSASAEKRYREDKKLYARTIKHLKKLHKDPEIYHRRKQSLRKTLSDPKWIEMNQKRVDERYADPEFVEHVSNVISYAIRQSDDELEDWVYEQFVINGRKKTDVADELKKGPHFINGCLRRYAKRKGIELEITKKAKKITVEQEAEAYELVYVDRMTLKEAGLKMGLTVSTIKGAVRKHAERNNIELPNLNLEKIFTDEQEDEICDLYFNSEKSQDMIAEEFCVSQPVISLSIDNCLKRRGTSSKEVNELKKKQQEKEDEKIYNMVHVEGKTKVDVAEYFDKTVSKIDHALIRYAKKFNITLPKILTRWTIEEKKHLHEMYRVHNKKVSEIVEEMDMTTYNVLYHIKSYEKSIGFKPRKISKSNFTDEQEDYMHDQFYESWKINFKIDE